MLLHGCFLYFYVSILLNIGEATKSIYITQDRLPRNLILITCTISGENAITYKTYLNCPLTENRMCYTDCVAHCRYESGDCVMPNELRSIERCQRDVMADDHIRMQYIINITNIKNREGEWYCSFADVNSKSVTLNSIPHEKILLEKKITTTAKSFVWGPPNPHPKNFNEKKSPNPSVDIRPAQIPVVNINQITEAPTEKGKISSKTDQEANDDMSFRMFITKYQVVVGIICLLCISLVLNFIFCIRDSLIKQFIENIKNNNASGKFLLFCICQSDSDPLIATSKHDRILKEPDYISNGASNCSKTDIFNLDSQRPLITSMYASSENSNPTSKSTRTPSMAYQELPPRIVPVSYDPCYVTSPRGYGSYMFNPYVMSKNQLEVQEFYNENLNQRHSYIFPSQIIPLDPSLTAEMHNSKKHASENDIDLIRHCDDQLPDAPN